MSGRLNRPRFARALPVILALSSAARVAAAENIDPSHEGLKYAYAENVGWINFKPTQGPGVTVSASALTGYAWGENIGWINLSPAHGGVLNDGGGTLSGFAWGENVGWIDFAPDGAGVHIDQDGRFIGKAWGENIGWISFSGTGPVLFGVRTSWRACLGDCDRNLIVKTGELVEGVKIALGNATTGTCVAAFDSNGDEKVVINELVAAVRRALAGKCT